MDNRSSKAPSEKRKRLVGTLRCAAGLAVCAVIVTALLLLLPAGKTSDPPLRRGDYSVTALLNVSEDGGFEVTSENPLKIRSGEDAVFNVTVAEGYRVSEEQEADVEYDAEAGTVTLRNVRYPTSATFSVRPLKKLTFSVESGDKDASVTVTVDGSSEIPLEIDEDTVIKVTAEIKEGKTFVGFSTGGTIADGGTVVSFSPEYEFGISDNIKLYANYVGEGARVIVYDTNGGHVTGSSESTIYIEDTDKNYICPNTLPDVGYMEREGYVLYSYNTKADGSGESYGLGWNVPIPESGVLKLYAQWMEATPETDFSFKVSGTSVSITKYNGNDTVVVIPETINGKKVTSIGANAFSYKKLETLVLSKNLSTVAENAFTKCTSLKTLYISDMITSMSDNSFNGCTELSKLYVNAVTAPRYTNTRNGTYQIKFERLMTAESPKLVIVAGSSSAYGIDSARLENAIGNQYNVVNYGTNQGTPACFYIEFVSHFISDGDILLHAPEPHKYQWGYNEINTTTWQIFEAAYNAFSYVDIRNYIKVFSSFASFNKTRVKMTERKYEDYTSETVNQYGDYIKYKKNQSASYGSDSVSNRLNTDYFTESNIAALNRSYDMITAAGGKVYISFSPINQNSLSSASKNKSNQAKYMDKVKNNYHGTVISTVGDYIMAGQYFYNSVLHLSTEGSHIRTDKLAEDILAQLEKEKK